LIDELDIYLHPIWQREIAVRLQEQFPHLPFWVATHSPFGRDSPARSLDTENRAFS